MKWPFGRSRPVERVDASASGVYAAAALVLGYPTRDLLDRLPAVADLAARAGVGEEFEPVLAYLGSQSLTDLQEAYAQEFDNSRRHALHLTYWVDGDTRRRGESLLRYKQAYRDSGLLVDLNGELPDYLPMALEFAVHDPARGRELLTASRPALELLRLALRDDELPHEGVLTAVCATLPGESPDDRLSVSRMNGWQPPTESVGLLDAPLAPYSMATNSPNAPSLQGARLPLLDARTLDEAELR
ncbi:nitrate reductase molybdenum cofactor assembly chaperone [Ammonicoccus fulvus]|uniref:Nitrate reductase molybdenum cofactor assembly chaperone n=1 Tax=Ammonicoccus fulvus TaxID=3138240 RepID=A0ABZ3FMM3_9ACTN